MLMLKPTVFFLQILPTMDCAHCQRVSLNRHGACVQKVRSHVFQVSQHAFVS